jgi:pSer/pThr/pTyr-binding forkhead associated (FHA) protein
VIVVFGSTRKLVPDDDSAEAASPQIKPIDLGMPRPWRIALRIMQLQIQLIFNLEGSMVIGRAQPETSAYPDIDLGPFNAEELGVSRQHLTISLDGTRVVVVDNQSSNGTKLNGERLRPNEAYPIRLEDELTLGTMALKVELLTNPVN